METPLKIPKDITISDFIKELEKLRDEIERKSEPGKIDGNHNRKSTVEFRVNNEPTDKIECYEIDEIEVDTMLGCMCPCGIRFWLKKTEEF
jgi:hypothetical protein